MHKQAVDDIARKLQRVLTPAGFSLPAGFVIEEFSTTPPYLFLMKRRLSSLQTFLMKIVFPAVWIFFVGFGTLTLFFGAEGPNAPPKWVALLVWIAGAAYICWSCFRLKEISVDDNYLYVSNYFKEIAVPLTEIYDVTENVWLKMHPVTIHLRSPSEFGDKIVFMPKARMFAFFSSHPVVNELKALAGRQTR